MAELRPIAFEHLLRRVLEEPARQGTLFDLPLRKAYRPAPGYDLSVDIHGHRAATPVGPAAGPHAQLAQNIVLSWLGGSRIIELKTVQILDELKIPRPCIDAATIGFNVEWSQELKLEDSLREYVAGWMLLRILRELDPLGLGPDGARAAEPILELSCGYDLKGIKTERMRNYLQRCQDVGPLIAELRERIPPEHRRLRDLDFRKDMTRCVTLSTFHGCPADEIEAIVEHLLRDHDVDVIVKLNPTLLGFDEVSYLLRDRMGYHDLRPRKSAFENDLRWEQAVGIGQRMSALAAQLGRTFGAKMTNTLVVDNHKSFFSDKEMYLSGPPLHVLAMQVVERWRNAFPTTAQKSPISFSGGIDQHNFVDAVACDLYPVTTCTDLLRPGGYSRLPKYLTNLEEAMADLGIRDRAELILRRFGHGPEAVRGVMSELREEDERIGALAPEASLATEKLLDELEHELLAAAKTSGAPGDGSLRGVLSRFHQARIMKHDGASAPPAARALVAELTAGLHERLVARAGLLNTREVASRATGDPRYAAAKNSKPPRKVGTNLVLLDCVSCDKCVPVCPNDANFAIETRPEEIAVFDLALTAAGTVERRPAAPFVLKQDRQWANYADACNECGNCDVFCPETGGPYVMKARFFGTLESFEATPVQDGFLVDAPRENGGRLRVRARLAGARYLVELGSSGTVTVENGRVRAEYDPRSGACLSAAAAGGDGAAPEVLPGAVFTTVRAVVRGALNSGKLNPVSASVPGARWPE